VLEGQVGGARDLFGECRIVKESRPVGEKRERLFPADERCHVSLEHDRLAVRIDELASRERIADRERRVAERAAEPLAQLSGRRRLGNVDDETGYRRASIARVDPRPGNTCGECH
jgi:hypothetical protein